MQKIEAQKEQQQNSYEEEGKRYRRFASEIDRKYKCPYQNCYKSYGQEGTLNQHIKLKHEKKTNIESGQGSVLMNSNNEVLEDQL